MLEAAVITAFTLFNGARVFSYLPQIRVIARDTNGASAVSFLTWGMWLCANASAALYAGIVARDAPLSIINSSNAFFCATVIVLTAYKRRSHRRAIRPEV